MRPLPQLSDSTRYWQEIYRQPLSYWQPALQEIATRHGLSIDDWQRSSLGRNVVFLSPSLVIKLGPPCWPGEMEREAAALQFIEGRLAVTTPRLVATGVLDGWDYLVQEFVPGTNLRDIWPQVDSDVKNAFAYQHGELMAAIQALPAGELPAMLAYDWAEMLAEQRACCRDEMRASGVDGVLVDQVEAYLDATPWAIDSVTPVLLHGDLDRINFQVSQLHGQWQITGIVDWGDVKIGPATHEFISPGVHTYQGDPAQLQQWYQGYRLREKGFGAEHQHLIMARSMLYYSEGFDKTIQKVPGAAACRDWDAMASTFWKMSPSLF